MKSSIYFYINTSFLWDLFILYHILFDQIPPICTLCFSIVIVILFYLEITFNSLWNIYYFLCIISFFYLPFTFLLRTQFLIVGSCMPDLLFALVKVNLGAAMRSVHCMLVIYNFNLFWVFGKPFDSVSCI
jgi:hypothetical protein